MGDFDADDDDDGSGQLMVRCRAKSGAVADLPVLDISAGGCMVASAGWDAAPGERVLTQVRGIGVQPSELVWIEDGRAGIAFETPLHTAVYDFLRSQLEQVVQVQRTIAAAEAEADRERAARARRVL